MELSELESDDDEDLTDDEFAEALGRALAKKHDALTEAVDKKYYLIDYNDDRHIFNSHFVTSAGSEEEAIEKLCNYYYAVPEDFEINKIEEVTEEEVEEFRADVRNGDIRSGFMTITEGLTEDASVQEAALYAAANFKELYQLALAGDTEDPKFETLKTAAFKKVRDKFKLDTKVANDVMQKGLVIYNKLYYKK